MKNEFIALKVKLNGEISVISFETKEDLQMTYETLKDFKLKDYGIDEIEFYQKVNRDYKCIKKIISL